MAHSSKPFPHNKGIATAFLEKAWNDGWMDEFSDDHFLIKAIEGRLSHFQGFAQYCANNIFSFELSADNFQLNFCINFSQKLSVLMDFFGEDKIKHFLTDQLSAGKQNYDESQFFRALSEISILAFWCMRAVTGQYEPKTNSKKNPEARFFCNNGMTVDIEVKTPGFSDFKGITEFAMPVTLLEEAGRTEFITYCTDNKSNGCMPRVNKLKDFLNSAAGKFEDVDHIKHMNLLYINWTFSEFLETGFEEAFSLLVHPVNGILNHKRIGIKFGVLPEVYEKITAVIVYTESLNGLMFGDLRWIWTRDSKGMPHFGIAGLHNCKKLFSVTQMNPYAEQLTPSLLYLGYDCKHVPFLMEIIERHLLQ